MKRWWEQNACNNFYRKIIEITFLCTNKALAIIFILKLSKEYVYVQKNTLIILLQNYRKDILCTNKALRIIFILKLLKGCFYAQKKKKTNNCNNLNIILKFNCIKLYMHFNCIKLTSRFFFSGFKIYFIL